MTRYSHTSSSRSAIAALEAQYRSILGLPNAEGTLVWDTPTQSADGTIWFIERISSSGWGNDAMFSYANVMTQLDLTNIIDRPYDPLWLPTVNP